jgi:hypothetical protein
MGNQADQAHDPAVTVVLIQSVGFAKWVRPGLTAADRLRANVAAGIEASFGAHDPRPIVARITHWAGAT